LRLDFASLPEQIAIQNFSLAVFLMSSLLPGRDVCVQ